jgi:hypothetical protein
LPACVGDFLTQHKAVAFFPGTSWAAAYRLSLPCVPSPACCLQAGKLPLLELEAEGAEAIKLGRGVDCLTVFLAPPSLELHEQRLRDWATESDEEIAERQALAAAELEAVQSNGVFDQVGWLDSVLMRHTEISKPVGGGKISSASACAGCLHARQSNGYMQALVLFVFMAVVQVVINDDLEQGFKQLKAAISKFRPDLIPPPEDNAAAQAARKAAASNQPVPLVVLGPSGRSSGEEDE